VLFWY